MRIAKGGFFCLVMMSEFTALGVGPTGVYTQKNLPKWQMEMNERAKELEELQRKNGSDDVYVPGKTIGFPGTVDDLSFSARQQLTTESLEPFKNLKTYREINVKTASEWCSGEHSNTTECWEWRCSENSQEANKPICITYKCTKQDYYSAHKQECDLNKACIKGQNSTECMKYKCYDTAAKDSSECVKWLCENDANYRATYADICNPVPNYGSSDPGNGYGGTDEPVKTTGTECTSSDKNAARAEYDTNGKCIIKECVDKYHVNAEKNVCEADGEYVLQIRKRQLKRESKEGRTGTTGRGCFAQCGEAMSDNLNNKAFYPVMGKYYCADSDRDGLVVENDDKTTTLKLTKAQLDKLRSLIVSSVADKDKCDGHVRNFIMFVGTLTPYDDFSETEEIYLDD